MKRWVIVSGGVLLVAVGSGMVWRVLHAPPAPQAGAFAVRVVRAVPADVPQQTTIVGATVRRAAVAVLRAEVSGTAHVRVHAGDVVRAGAPLVQIAAPERAAQAAAAAAHARQVEAVEARARRHWDDLKPEDRRALKLASVAARARAAAAAAVAAKATVRAPYAGVVQELLVEDGATVLPGTPLLRIGRRGTCEVRSYISATAAQAMAIGDTVRVFTAQTSVEGHVVRRAPQADPHTQKTMVTVQFACTAFPLGTFVHIAVPVPDSTTAAATPPVRIPRSAIVQAYYDTFVFIRDGDHARRVPVRVLAATGLSAIVTGLPAAADVIVTRAHRLADGAAITVVGEGA